MKKDSILLMFMLALFTFVVPELKAQTDGYFKVASFSEEREGVSGGLSGLNGLTFGDFSSGISGGFGQQDGLSFGDFAGESLYKSEVPVGQGSFILTTTGILYLIAKRRKENK